MIGPRSTRKRENMEQTSKVGILGMSGSGRKRSYNSALLEAAKQLLPPDATLDVVDISRLPLYNQDLEHDLPEAVNELKKKIRGADAILIATPEHNYSITAVLKNAIEWGNRPPRDASWSGKPAAIISASTGLRGGARAQLHLRQIMIDLNMHSINRPLLLVANAKDKFNENLQLTDEETLQTLREVLSSLVEWTRKLQR
jgi:chromate reductase, NAD(P)H dehydrogenase (quinone)